MVTFKRDFCESRCIDEETNRRVLWLGEEPGRVEVWVTAAQLAEVKGQFDQYGVLGVDEIPTVPMTIASARLVRVRSCDDSGEDARHGFRRSSCNEVDGMAGGISAVQQTDCGRTREPSGGKEGPPPRL